MCVCVCVCVCLKLVSDTWCIFHYRTCLTKEIAWPQRFNFCDFSIKINKNDKKSGFQSTGIIFDKKEVLASKNTWNKKKDRKKFWPKILILVRKKCHFQYSLLNMIKIWYNPYAKSTMILFDFYISRARRPNPPPPIWGISKKPPPPNQRFNKKKLVLTK